MLLGLIAPANVGADSGTVVDAAASMTTRLEPGNNFVGWIGAPTSLRELFATVPEILVVYAWDADQRRYRMASPKLPEHHWTVHDIEPNAAYVLRIAGSLAVEWERPAVPVRGLAELRSGFNWVSWAGPSDWTVTDIARGIGRSLVSITLGNQVYRPAQPDSAANWPLIRRGDALVVTVSRNVNWLQPAGIMPELVFLGNISATLQQQARDDLQSVMDFYLTQFGIQPDGSSFTIRIAATLQSLIDYESAASGELDEAAISEWRHLWNESLAWSREDIVVNEELYSCTQCAGRYTLTHELLHKLQEQLRDSFGDLPSWLTEGTANWAHSIHGMLDRHREYRSVVRHLRSKAATAPSLESTEQRNAQWEYSLGHFAVLSLVETGGDCRCGCAR